MPDTNGEVRHAAEEPVTIEILCRCVTGLLLGGFLGIGLVFLSASFDPRKAPISPVPEVQIVSASSPASSSRYWQVSSPVGTLLRCSRPAPAFSWSSCHSP